MNKKPTGLLPAVHTPFDSAGNINLSVVSEQADRLIEMQCGGVYVGGTTGECYSLTCEEPVSYTHPPSPRDATLSRMPSSA